MKIKKVLVLILLSASIRVGAGNYKPDPAIDIIHYEFRIELSDSNNVIHGIAVIKVLFKNAAGHITLDLKNASGDGKGMQVKNVMVSGSAAVWSHSGDRLDISLPETAPAGSSADISVTYSGIPRDGLIISQNKFGERTFFSDNWPDRGSNYLPVVDHPSDKATVDFIITAPSQYRVVANGQLLEEYSPGKGMTVTHWQENVPIPVKVMSFAAANFAIGNAGKAGDIQVWTWVFERNRSEGFRDYAVATEPLKYYSELAGPYPYEKLANVQSKTIFGGLENAGCIFYAENSVTGEGRDESLIAHEEAHQWFGNSVTEKDWHHIWLSEGFATYLTNMYLQNKYGEERFRTAMKNDRNRVLRFDSGNTTAVIDTTITGLMSLLNTDTYQKGGWVLHMLRNYIGDEAFKKGLREYYSRFRDGNALTSDFESVMETVSGRDLREFFYQWLYVKGCPALKIYTGNGEKEGTMKIFVEQTQPFIYSFSLEVIAEDQSGSRKIIIPVTGKKVSVEIAGSRDIKITPDPDVKLLFSEVK
ncbi:MAG TPA: M1 family metallopeptidase [Bacteroidales bacterium]|nr:M1 family metallopeptidase [Bacteroidales bacterium]